MVRKERVEDARKLKREKNIAAESDTEETLSENGIKNLLLPKDNVWMNAMGVCKE